MKIVIINGSPRNNGATAKILKCFAEKLSSMNEAETEYINISELDIRPCIGCMSCYKNGKCCIDDDGDRISQKIGEADGLIIGTPTYASNVSGQLKQLIDRGHFVIEQLLTDKYTVCVATGVNYGNKDAANVLDKLFRYSGGYVSGRITENIPFNGDPLDDSIRQRIGITAFKLYNDIKKKKTHPFQKIYHKIIFSFGIRPFVIKQGKSYRGVTEKWKSMGINI